MDITTIQLKTEIQKVLDEVPEESLIDILYLLKELQKQPSEKIRLERFIKQTIAEDRALFEKLAK